MTSPIFSHKSVMFDEVMEVFAPVESGLFIDGTLGGGGHSQGFLEHGSSRLVLGLDRDPAAIDAATKRLGKFQDRFLALHSDFDELDNALAHACSAKAAYCSAPSALFLDLGVSSPQLDRADRGFSYRLEGPLDMRMDPTQGSSLSEYLDSASPDDLAALLRENGESRFAFRIATAIIRERPYASTVQLADVIKNAIPAAARRTGGHPATRVFQALRIRVNNELEKLTLALERAFEVLSPGGRIAVLSYHSGEDSIVKSLFRQQVTGGCTCPVQFDCVCGAVPHASYVVRSKAPSKIEIEENPRSRSARLRAIQLISVNESKDGKRVG